METEFVFFDRETEFVFKCAPHLVAIEQLRVKRFIDGLKNYLFRAIARHGNMTYEEPLDRVLTIEQRNRDRGETSCDSRKRPTLSHLVVDTMAKEELRAIRANKRVSKK